MAKPHAVAVIGSLNIDFVTTTPYLPVGGETMTAHSFITGFGGKGANQAIACSRLSRSKTSSSSSEVKTSMVGFLGADTFCTDYLEALTKESIDTTHIRTISGMTTGVANIIVEAGSGENRIMLATGANYACKDEVVDLVPTEADVVVFQLEIPLQLVLYNMKLARERGKYVILNPAPAVELPDEVFGHIDCLVMNESEAEILGRGKETGLAAYLARGVRDLVVVTLGADGVSYMTSRQDRSAAATHVPGRKAKVVDTTAAGDTFVGALAVQIAKNGGKTSEDPAAMFEFANAAAARTVEKAGAMSAIPFFDEVKV